MSCDSIFDEDSFHSELEDDDNLEAVSSLCLSVMSDDKKNTTYQKTDTFSDETNYWPIIEERHYKRLSVKSLEELENLAKHFQELQAKYVAMCNHVNKLKQDNQKISSRALQLMSEKSDLQTKYVEEVACLSKTSDELLNAQAALNSVVAEGREKRSFLIKEIMRLKGQVANGAELPKLQDENQVKKSANAEKIQRILEEEGLNECKHIIQSTHEDKRQMITEGISQTMSAHLNLDQDVCEQNSAIEFMLHMLQGKLTRSQLKAESIIAGLSESPNRNVSLVVRALEELCRNLADLTYLTMGDSAVIDDMPLPPPEDLAKGDNFSISSISKKHPCYQSARGMVNTNVVSTCGDTADIQPIKCLEMLRNSFNRRSSEISKLNIQLSSLKVEVANGSRKGLKLENDNSHLKAEIERLESELSRARQMALEAVESVEATRRQIDSENLEKQQISTARSKVLDKFCALQAEVSAQFEAKQELLQHVDELEFQIHLTKNDLDKCFSNLNRSCAENRLLRQELKTAQNQLVDYKGRFDASEAEVTKLRTENQNQFSLCETHNMELARVNCELKEKTMRLDDLSQLNESQKKEIKAALKEKAEFSEKSLSYQLEVTKMADGLYRTETERDELKKELSNIQKEKLKLERKNAEFNKLLHTNEDARLKYKSEISHLEKTCVELNQKLGQVTEENELNVKRLDQQQTEFKLLQEEVIGKSEILARKENEIYQLGSQLSDFDNLEVEYKEREKYHKNQLHLLNQENLRLKRYMQKSRAKIYELKSGLERKDSEWRAKLLQQHEAAKVNETTLTANLMIQFNDEKSLIMEEMQKLEENFVRKASCLRAEKDEIAALSEKDRQTLLSNELHYRNFKEKLDKMEKQIADKNAELKQLKHDKSLQIALATSRERAKAEEIMSLQQQQHEREIGKFEKQIMEINMETKTLDAQLQTQRKETLKLRKQLISLERQRNDMLEDLKRADNLVLATVNKPKEPYCFRTEICAQKRSLDFAGKTISDTNLQQKMEKPTVAWNFLKSASRLEVVVTENKNVDADHGAVQ